MCHKLSCHSTDTRLHDVSRVQSMMTTVDSSLLTSSQKERKNDVIGRLYGTLSIITREIL